MPISDDELLTIFEAANGRAARYRDPITLAQVCQAMRVAVLREREACARVCWAAGDAALAAAIWSRGNALQAEEVKHG